MFYEPGKTDHGLAYNPFKACVVPRPIGWISTVSPTSKEGQEPIYNLAPFSQFNNLTFDPPYVMFSAHQANTSDEASTEGLENNLHVQRSPGFNRKDSVHNVESTGYFCWQLATYPLREMVNATGETLPYGVSEFDHLKIEKTWSQCLPIKIPMVAESPVRFECQYHSTIRLPANPPMGTVDVVIGRVLGIHVDDKFISADGKIDVSLTQPIARLGYFDYAVIRPEDMFSMVVPNAHKRGLAGMEGRPRNEVKPESKSETNGSTGDPVR